MEKKAYVAIVDFSLNMTGKGGKTLTHEIKSGDKILFDGRYAEFSGEAGEAGALRNVIGEWIKPYSGGEDGLPSIQKVSPAGSGARPSRNATGGRIVEDSSVDYDSQFSQHKCKQKSTSEELESLIEYYDSVKQGTKISNDDPSDLTQNKAKLNIIDSDEEVVGQVSKSSLEVSSPTINSQGVHISQQNTNKKIVVDVDGEVAKETNYDRKIKEESEYKKLEVSYEDGGVEIVKAKTASINSDGATAVESIQDSQVVRSHDVVKETNYEDQGSTDVSGTTTQAHTVSKLPNKKKRAVKSKGASSQAEVAPQPKRPSVSPLKEYVATQEIHVNFDGSQESIKIARGESFLYNGKHIVYGEHKGSSLSLVKMIGEWYLPIEQVDRSTLQPPVALTDTKGNSKVVVDEQGYETGKTIPTSLQCSGSESDSDRHTTTDNQEATIVGKASKLKNTEVMTSDGILIKGSVGPSEPADTGDVSFGGNTDDIIMDENAIVGGDSDIDVNELLEGF